MLPTSYGVHFHCPSLVELLISSEIAQRRRNKREEPGSKGPELSASWIIGTWEMVGLTGTKWENRWDVSILFQTLISGPGFILPHRPASAKGEKKHINFVETFYLMSLRSHVALIFFFFYTTFHFPVWGFPWVEGILKAFCFHSPRIYALTLDALVTVPRGDRSNDFTVKTQT